MQKLLTTELPTPSQEECFAVWRDACVRINPTWRERQYHRAQALYLHLGLDWRNPEHKAHVEGIVARHGEPKPGCRETND